MPRPFIEIDADDTIRALGKVEGGTDDLKDTHAKGASVVERQVEKEVPKGETLELFRSVRSTAQAKTGVVRAGFASVPYAPIVHWGWRKRGIKPNEFVYRAIDVTHDEVADIYHDGLDGLVKKHGLN